MNVLLTGASGLLGRAVFARLSKRDDLALTAVAYSRATPPYVKADIRDPEAIERLFAAAKPAFVVHAAAERRPDVVDKDPAQARALNVAATGAMAAACARHGAFLLYISTDYVFDGTNPPYYPDSPVHPINEYGIMKLEGERCAAAALAGGAQAGGASAGAGKPRACTLRIPILYGPVERLEESSVSELALLLVRREPCAVEHWASRYPAHVDDIAAAIEKIIDAYAADSPALASPAPGKLPTFQLSGPRPFTKYEMLMSMARALGMDASFARPNAAPPAGAPRPKDCRMDTSALESLGYRPAVDFDEAIGRAIAPFFQAQAR
ncbi:SDR family oxidoreductase [bacterium]|nr:SDR family oxidoreductase [bacterium]